MGETRGTYREKGKTMHGFDSKTWKKEQLERHSCRWEPEMMEAINWIHLTWDRYKWQALVDSNESLVFIFQVEKLFLTYHMHCLHKAPLTWSSKTTDQIWKTFDIITYTNNCIVNFGLHQTNAWDELQKKCYQFFCIYIYIYIYRVFHDFRV